jgi:hypothetical protein
LSLKEIKARHEIAEQLISKDLSVNVKTIHLDRAELIKMVEEARKIISALLYDGWSNANLDRIRKLDAKLEGE